MEIELNLTKYIQSNPELANSVRPLFRNLEKSGGISDDNFNDWESVFLKCEAQFKDELIVLEAGEEIKGFEMWFPHPSELQEQVFQTMLTEGLHIKAYVTGKLESPPNALQFRFPIDLGEVVLTTLQPQVQWVVTGEVSYPVYLFDAGSSGEGEGVTTPSIFRYIRFGFTHIIPLGLDHILFFWDYFCLRPGCVRCSSK